MKVPFLELKDTNSRYAEELHEAVLRVTDSGRYLLGDELDGFERSYADYIGTDYCIGTGNGLDALSLIFRAYMELGRLSPGDEVLVPANTFIASILAITENDLIPVLIEPSLDHYQMDDFQNQSPTVSPSLWAVCLYAAHFPNCQEAWATVD